MRPSIAVNTWTTEPEATVHMALIGAKPTCAGSASDHDHKRVAVAGGSIAYSGTVKV